MDLNDFKSDILKSVICVFDHAAGQHKVMRNKKQDFYISYFK